MLDPAALAVVGIGVELIGQSLILRVGPAVYDPGDSSYFDYAVTPRDVDVVRIVSGLGRRRGGPLLALFSPSTKTRF